jgi:hypothetical protein
VNTLKALACGEISLFEWGVYLWLCLKADDATGHLLTCARQILAHCPRERASPRTTQRALMHLERIGWITRRRMESGMYLVEVPDHKAVVEHLEQTLNLQPSN